MSVCVCSQFQVCAIKLEIEFGFRFSTSSLHWILRECQAESTETSRTDPRIHHTRQALHNNHYATIIRRARILFGSALLSNKYNPVHRVGSSTRPCTRHDTLIEPRSFSSTVAMEYSQYCCKVYIHAPGYSSLPRRFLPHVAFSVTVVDLQS